MRKLFVNILRIIGILLILFVVFAIWYQRTYSMEVASAFEINTPESSKHLLIATQGSSFKDSIVSGIVKHYKEDDLYIKVMDVNELERVQVSQWDAVCLIHTWEYYKPPIEVETFIDRSSQNMDRVVVLTTSGDSKYKMEGVDAITGASIMENVPKMTTQLIERLDGVLWKGVSSSINHPDNSK